MCCPQCIYGDIKVVRVLSLSITKPANGLYLKWYGCTQDLAVVVLLMLIPLLAPSESGAPAGLKTIAQALGIAALKVASHQMRNLDLALFLVRSLSGMPNSTHAWLLAPQKSVCTEQKIEPFCAALLHMSCTYVYTDMCSKAIEKIGFFFCQRT